jgi:nitrite reductase (NO-forming)
MNDKQTGRLIVIAFILATLLFLGVVPDRLNPPTYAAPTVQATPVAEAPPHNDAHGSVPETVSSNVAQEISETGVTVEYTISTIMGQTPPMAFIGIGGDIEGVINPTLKANVGDRVIITIVNGDPIEHDFVIPDLAVHSEHLTTQGQEETVDFIADKPGSFKYICSVPGHEQIGMLGLLEVTGEAIVVEGEPEHTSAPADDHAAVDTAPAAESVSADAVSVVLAPDNLPAPIGDRAPETIDIELISQEIDGVLADGTTYTYWTFNGTVPGPMIRVMVGDTVNLTLKNDATSSNAHSIDLHAVTGPGGGAVYTQTLPGEETTFSFKALNPGVYVYHCATPSVAHHITNGMYGLIVVEPEGGLPEVDREFYVMQGELYTAQAFGTPGHLSFDYDAMLDENPEYFIFNGSTSALTADETALRANVGETVRIFFGVGGPNFTSSFHVIGEIFDRAYNLASITSAPLTDVQTVLVPPGGAAVVEFGLEVPGRYILVDHALSRMERGLAGFLYAEGEEDAEIFHGTTTEGSGH